MTTEEEIDAAEAADRLQLPLYIHVPDVPVTEWELAKYAGEKCDDYDESCPACESWKEWEETGRITVLIEREILLFGH